MHQLHISATLLIFGKKKVGRAALLWKISTRFVFNGKRRRILHGTKGEHKYRLATAHMALLCENGQGKKTCVCSGASVPSCRSRLCAIIRLHPTAEGMEIPMGGRQKFGNPKKKVEFLMR
jgi:hypothetical protein